MIKLKKILNESKFSSAYNLKYLKNIRFNPGPWEFVDKELQKKPFGIGFREHTPKIDQAIAAAIKEHPAVADMVIEPIVDDYGNHVVVIKKGNYAGLTYMFKALDDLYGKYGAGMGWHISGL